MPGSHSVSVGISLVNFRLIVTYTSGPVTYTLTPAGGDVEIGQTVVVSGPNASELTYAALQGNQVIPIIPKIINGNEVTLEIPVFPTDPCFDCVGDCPTCDDCFTACSENLEGEDCIACMQSCLDCLTDCLEDLQLSEECQQSTQGPVGGPTPITIIANVPFTGSVPLGNFIVLVANASGIYRFVEGKTNDTIYQASRDGDTYDVKIPNPGARTGFFRS